MRRTGLLLFLVFALGCEGSDGPAGPKGDPGDPGKAAENCTLTDNQDGTATVACPGGTTVTIPTGTGDGGIVDTVCSVTDNGDGTVTVKCPNSPDVTVPIASTTPEPELVNDPISLDVKITKVEIASAPVVTFEVKNQDGYAFPLLTQKLLTDGRMRWAIARLEPAAANSGDADNWQSYVNREEDTTGKKVGPNDTPVLAKAVQASYESKGTLKYIGGGVYTYTFDTDVKNVTTPKAVSYNADLLHRVVMQLEYPLRDGNEIILNPFFDWVPSGSAATVSREIAMTKSCNECHTNLAIHGGGRIDIKYCVVCHNPGTTDANSGNSLDMAYMTHKIHRGSNLKNGYVIWGYRDSKHDYSHVGYPQDINCRKCHSADDTETPQGGNWKTRPTIAACGSCHDDVNFATGDGHSQNNLAQADNKQCANCHTPEKIEEKHLTENATPNNPNLPAGLPDIKYELVSATMSGNDLTVKFRLLKDGTAFDLNTLEDGLKDGGRYPSLMLMYAGQQNGVDPADWNNIGRTAGQPQTVGLDTLTGVTYAAASGEHTATITGAFPAGATMRAVAIQGYFYWRVRGTNYDPNDDTTYTDYARHAISPYLPVTGDKTRRSIVDSAKCANCHEWFEAHGGNRVLTVEVCAGCHVPNLSSSGRELDLANPEANQGLKDLIHGIHGAAARTTPLDFVRNFRNAARPYTFINHDQLTDYPNGHVVTYPQSSGNCQACHKAGTHRLESIPKTALPSTTMTGDGKDTTTAGYAALRTGVPNATDTVTSPMTAACGSCHNSVLSIAHYKQNGGLWEVPRTQYWAGANTETCTICHGAGRSADVDKVHGLE
jgi:OmcA/MtrC family decaheme c-type cytochrome